MDLMPARARIFGGSTFEDYVERCPELSLLDQGRPGHAVLPTAACCLLPAACCLLPAACCLLPAACCLLPAAGQRQGRPAERFGRLLPDP
ncbi:hypothetical protein ABZ543_16690 [Streptomyces roseifaciens]